MNPILNRVILTLLITLLSSKAAPALAPSEQKPSFVFINYPLLLEVKQSVIDKEPKHISKFKEITRAADKALKGGTLSVTHKTGKPPSGDKHDYLSQSPYWWPDPKKRNGLPFIRKDGKVYPKSRGEHVDVTRKSSLFKRLQALGVASFLSNDPKYQIMAVSLLETWFVNPETRMNPHLNYAQGTPGRSDGRRYGIIEWRDIEHIITPIQLLRAEGSLPEKTDKALVVWFEQYAHWLQTSKLGRMERDTKNNHATWYDVQLVAILLFLDRQDEAKSILEKVKTKRIATQIEPDGRQPHELARTKSLTYSKMNLAAFKKLVQLGKKVDVDLWDYETKDGRSIRKAENYILSNTTEGKKWPHPQL